MKSTEEPQAPTAFEPLELAPPAYERTGFTASAGIASADIELAPPGFDPEAQLLTGALSPNMELAPPGFEPGVSAKHSGQWAGAMELAPPGYETAACIPGQKAAAAA
jgi:hypothetical protein